MFKKYSGVPDILSKIPMDGISKTRTISGTARGAGQMGNSMPEVQDMKFQGFLLAGTG